MNVAAFDVMATFSATACAVALRKARVQLIRMAMSTSLWRITCGTHRHSVLSPLSPLQRRVELAHAVELQAWGRASSTAGREAPPLKGRWAPGSSRPA